MPQGDIRIYFPETGEGEISGREHNWRFEEKGLNVRSDMPVEFEERMKGDSYWAYNIRPL